MYDSNVVSRRHANIIKQTVGYLAFQMASLSPDIHFSFLTNTCPDETETRLGDYVDPHQFVTSIESMENPGIGMMFHRIRQHSFSLQHGGRVHAQRFAVVFIDDEIDDQRALIQASRTKFKGIRLFVVSIGHNVNDHFAEGLASAPAEYHYIKMDSYEDLTTWKQDIVDEICSGKLHIGL